MEENRIKIWIHKIKDTAVVLLHFLDTVQNFV